MVIGMLNENKFKDTVVSEIGEISISNTQKYRVLVIRDSETKDTYISAQKWWRRGEDSLWLAGKGFRLSSVEAKKLGDLLIQGSGEIEN